MNIDFLSGLWTYRSFLNIPAEVTDFNQLRFGQGEMVFWKALEPGHIRGQLAFRSNPPAKDDPRLVLTGAFQTGNPFSVRFQGVGLADTVAKGWVYDYVGYYVPDWPHGVDQKGAIVGSVIRTVPHGDGQGGVRPAGVVGSFIAVKHNFLEPREAIPLPESVRGMLASRSHRLHHVAWHGVRNAWLNLDDETRDHITALGWATPRPSMKQGAPIITNGSGEDFLYMHRRMIRMVDAAMWDAGEKPIKGWITVPAPDSIIVEPDFDAAHPTLMPPGNPTGYAVPPAWVNPADEMTNLRIASLKTDDYYWSRMKWWDRQYKNAEYLATLTLGELGSLLEYSVHNDMHMRWASVPREPDGPNKGQPIPQGRPDWDISARWDNPDYDFLGEFYSSHVNPVFWRLHGWVDDRIGDWFAAHEATHPGEIVQCDLNGAPWFKPGKWVLSADPWEGPTMAHHAHEGHPGGDDDVATMEKVVALLFPPPAPVPAPPPEEAELKVEAIAPLVSGKLITPATPSRHLTWF